MLHVEKGLGALLVRDPRDDLHPMAAHLSLAGEVPKSRTWLPEGKVRDQLSNPHCVGYASRSFLDWGKVVNLGGPDAREIYREAQRRDEWPGENYEGTSIRGACKYLKELDFIGEYVWARGYEDLALWLRTRGPVLLATRWTSGMYRPDWRGHVKPSGSVEGGHAYLVYGITRWGSFLCRNSWGLDWGRGGDFYLSKRNFEELTRIGYWEATAPVEIAR